MTAAAPPAPPATVEARRRPDAGERNVEAACPWGAVPCDTECLAGWCRAYRDDADRGL